MFKNSEIKTEAGEGEANVKDKIVTLSTCTGNESTRFVVQGKRVDAEDTGNSATSDDTVVVQEE